MRRALMPCAMLVMQDDDKEKYTTDELLTRVPLEEILALKKEDEEKRKLKASLARHLNKAVDPWDDL